MSHPDPETVRTPLASHEHSPCNSLLLRLPSSVHTSAIAKGARVEGDEHDPGPPRYEPWFQRPPKPSPQESPWKHRLHSILDHPTTHKLVLLFIILDLLVVLTEVFIDLFSFQDCRNHVGMDKFEEGHATEVAMESLRIASLVILAGFLVENLLRLVVMGCTFYLQHWLHLFDLAVVSTSFFVTIFLHGALEEVVALFIFLRLWRVMRIVDSVAMTLEDKADKHKQMKNQLIKQLKQHIRELEDNAKQGQGNSKHPRAGSTPLPNNAAQHEKPYVTFSVQDEEYD